MQLSRPSSIHRVHLCRPRRQAAGLLGRHAHPHAQHHLPLLLLRRMMSSSPCLPSTLTSSQLRPPGETTRFVGLRKSSRSPRRNAEAEQDRLSKQNSSASKEWLTAATAHYSDQLYFSHLDADWKKSVRPWLFRFGGLTEEFIDDLLERMPSVNVSNCSKCREKRHCVVRPAQHAPPSDPCTWIHHRH